MVITTNLVVWEKTSDTFDGKCGKAKIIYKKNINIFSVQNGTNRIKHVLVFHMSDTVEGRS